MSRPGAPQVARTLQRRASEGERAARGGQCARATGNPRAPAPFPARQTNTYNLEETISGAASQRIDGWLIARQSRPVRTAMRLRERKLTLLACRAREPLRRVLRLDPRSRAPENGAPDRGGRDLTQFFRREARAAHAEQHDLGEPIVDDRIGERTQPGDQRRHEIDRQQPSRLAMSFRVFGSEFHASSRRAQCAEENRTESRCAHAASNCLMSEPGAIENAGDRGGIVSTYNIMV